MKINIVSGIVIALALSLMSCVKEHHTGPVGDDGAGQVRIPVITTNGDYEAPVTRAGSAQENTIGTTPWVIVFHGSGDGAIFAEAVQAYAVGSQSYVTLTSYASQARLLVIANAPEYFYDGTSSHVFNEANLSAQLDGKTFADAVNNILLTTPLASPYMQGVPYTDPVQPLPMSNVLDVSGISSNTSIGTTDNKFMLKRIVAKVIVTNTDTDFDLKAATVADVSRNGRLYQSGSSLKVNSGNQTYYYSSAMWGVASATNQTTARNPIYVYESLADESPHAVIEGVYDGITYYYKLGFYGAHPSYTPMSVFRNNLYTFNITQIKGPGYATFAEALNAGNPANNVIYDITVTDLVSYEMIDNGRYYMGVSNSLFMQFYPYDRTLTSSWPEGLSMNGIVVASVYTDAPASLTTNSITMTGGSGKATLITTHVNTAGSPTRTDILMNLQPEFTSVTLTIKLGTLTKNILVLGTTTSPGGGATYYDNFTTAAITDFGSGEADWMQLYYNDDSSSSINLAQPGKIKLVFNPNTSHAIRSGTLYLSHADGKRYKFNVIQDTYLYFYLHGEGGGTNGVDETLLIPYKRGELVPLWLYTSYGIFRPGYTAGYWWDSLDDTGRYFYMGDMFLMTKDYHFYLKWTAMTLY